MFTSEAINLNSESSGISTAPNSLCLTDNDNSFSFNAGNKNINLPGNKKDAQQQQKQLASMHLLNDDRILHNLLFMEDNYCIQSNYFLVVQNEIKPWMRTVLANWMLEVCENQKCEDDVFVLAMNILDRFLSVQQVSRRHLQLLGSVCMFIASKLRSAKPLSAETLVIYTDHSIFIEELLDWEQLVLHKLHWDVCSVTANDFLPYLLTKLAIVDETDVVFKQYLSSFIALCSTDFRFSILTPSMVASGCIINTANLLMKHNKSISIASIMQRLSDITFIEIDCLKECNEQIEELIESNYQLHPEIDDLLKEKCRLSALTTNVEHDACC